MKKKKATTHTTYVSLLSFMLFLLAFALRYQGILQDTLPALLLVVALFAGGIFLLRQTKKTLPLTELISLGAVYILLFVDKSAVLNQTLYGLAQPFLFAIFGFLLIRIYDVTLEFDFKNIKKIMIIFGVSILFAYFFLLLNEPFPSFVKSSFFLLLIYTFFVSLGEELVFRGTSFSLVRRRFNDEQAVHIQALIFAVIHLLGISALFRFFSVEGSLLLSSSFAYANVIIYAVALYGFAVIAARYATGKKKVNIMYPVFFHWLVNFLNLLIIVL